MNITYSFKGRSVLVTGGAQGIGFQIASDFLKSGAQVTIWDYSVDALDSARMEFASYGDSVRFSQVNVADFRSCSDAASELTEPLHVLVNNAGITRDKSFLKMASSEFEAVINTNLTGIFHVTKSLVEHFDAASTSKRIINMASVVALYGNFGQTNYVAAKAGLIGMTKTLSRELGKKGFTVNAIAPGFTLTKMVQAMPEEILSQMAQKVPVGRLGNTVDISNACLFLASEEAGYINGAVMSVDGGLVT